MGSLVASGDVGGEVVPFTGLVSFKVVLQKGNRVQVNFVATTIHAPNVELTETNKV